MLRFARNDGACWRSLAKLTYNRDWLAADVAFVGKSPDELTGAQRIDLLTLDAMGHEHEIEASPGGADEIGREAVPDRDDISRRERAAGHFRADAPCN